MDWRTMLAYITGAVDEELLPRNEYLVARIEFFEIRSRVACATWRTAVSGRDRICLRPHVVRKVV